MRAIRGVFGVLVLVASLVVAIPAAASTVILVPQDFPTFAAAVAAASDGDEILVAPGSYLEMVDASSKELTVRSSHGPSVTTLRLTAELGTNSSLIGFRFEPFDNFSLGSRLIRASGDNVTISDNVFESVNLGNQLSAIWVDGGSASVTTNRFSDVSCSRQLVSVAAAEVLIENNIVVGGDCDAVVLDPSAAAGSLVINNTIVNNDGRALYLGSASSIARNNVIAFNGEGIDGAGVSPTLENNLVFGNTVDYTDVSDPTGSDGNISADPLLAAPPYGYRITVDSPAIDAGSPNGAPGIDVDGTIRPIDGDGQGGAAIDIGAHEYGVDFGSITGTVRNADGRGIESMCVSAWDGATRRGLAVSALGGSYSLGLVPGLYTVQFEDCMFGIFDGEWHDGVSSQGAATAVAVADGAASAGIDGTLTTTTVCRGQFPTMLGTPSHDHLHGSEGTDVILGRGGFDNLNGHGGDDFICTGDTDSATVNGGPGDDELQAGLNGHNLNGDAGNDLLIGGSGNDGLSGGTGADTLLGGGGNDALQGGGGADLLRGMAGDDFIGGGPGDDTLDGGKGDDTLEGRGGNDTMDGGEGDDLLSFRFAPSITADLSTGLASGEGADSFVNMEDIRGTDGDDVLIGDDGPNVLRGRDGDDLIRGGAGDDRIIAGADDDRIIPGPGDDYVDGGSAGTNTLDFSESTNGVTVNLDTGVGTGEGSDRYTKVVNVIGSEFDDHLTAHRWASTLRGGSGNDTLIGLGNEDRLLGGSGNDTLDGGPGVDELLGGSGNDIINGGGGNDSLDGGSGRDTIDGGAGDDLVLGGKGADNLSGGPGMDTIVGSSGGDTIDGGDDADEIRSGAGADTVYGGAGADDISTGAKPDIVNGGSGSDLIKTGAGADDITGGGGHDLILAGTGADTIDGSEGDDTLVGEKGNDTIDGGPGIDTSSYFSADAGVNADLATGVVTGGAGNDTLTAIEQLVGSTFDDVLLGDSNDNLIEPRAGNDQADGRSGEDLISFGFSPSGINADMGAGIATGEGNDTFVSFEWLLASDSDDDIVGSAGPDVIFTIRGKDEVSAGGGDDAVIGGNGNDILRGQAGDDFLDGGGGINQLIGGSGVDTCVQGIPTSCEITDDRLGLPDAGNDLDLPPSDHSTAVRWAELALRFGLRNHARPL